MNRRLLVLFALAVAAPAAAQAVPEESQAGRTELGWFRVPSIWFDPFRHAFVPHWGFVVSVGGYGENNTLNASDLGAILLLSDSSDLRTGDAIDAMGLLPRGADATAAGGGDAGFYLGGPIGPVAVGVTLGGHGYGAFRLDDQAVALLRDGNGGLQEFSLGNTGGVGLATADAGLHMLYRTAPLGSPDGVRITFGAGLRLVRPVVYAAARSTVANGGRLLVSNDSILANLGVEILQTPADSFGQITDAIFSGTNGSGTAADFVLRAEWPTNGLAIEGMIANLGSATVRNVERTRYNVNVASTRLDVVLDSLDVQLDSTRKVVDTVTVDLTLPRVARLAASAWANQILQLDATLTFAVSGDFETPAVVEIGSTWRFVRTLPLRAGLVLGRTQGIGYTAGLGVEGRNFLFRLSGQSLGGFLKSARGAGAQLVLGTFF